MKLSFGLVIATWVGIALFFIFLAPRACTAPDDARRVLSQEGYTQVQLTGYRYWSCGRDDSFHTGFTALSPNKQTVTGTVCSGWLKGHTTRLD